MFFDDFKVEHIKSPVIQTSDYYPYGLISQSFERENSVKQNYLYNGKEIQDELNLGWYDYQARQYDPGIGRFLSVDPAAELMRRISPYAYAFNNPLRFIDPDGMIPEEATGDPEKKKQEQPAKTWDDLGPMEKFLGTMVLLTERVGNLFNQVNGQESGDFNSNIERGSEVITEVVMTAQMTHEIATSGPATGKNLSDDAVSVGKNLGDDAAKAASKITNEVPSEVARVIPTSTGDVKTLGSPQASDVFVTAASDIQGLNAKQIAEKLTIPESSGGFQIFNFPTPPGIASPINRPNPGFVGRGMTAGGAREFVIPNQAVPKNATRKIVH